MAESHCRLATLYSSFHCLEKRQSWSNNDATRLWRPAMDGLPLVIRTEAGWECGGMSPHACKVIRSEGPPLFLKVFVFVQFFSFFFRLCSILFLFFRLCSILSLVFLLFVQCFFLSQQSYRVGGISAWKALMSRTHANVVFPTKEFTCKTSKTPSKHQFHLHDKTAKVQT